MPYFQCAYSHFSPNCRKKAAKKDKDSNLQRLHLYRRGLFTFLFQSSVSTVSGEDHYESSSPPHAEMVLIHELGIKVGSTARISNSIQSRLLPLPFS